MHDEIVLRQQLEDERRARLRAEALVDEKEHELTHLRRNLMGTMRALDEEAAKLRAVLQTAAEAIITFDADGHIQSVNPAAESVFGHCGTDLLGKHVRTLLPSNDLHGNTTTLDESFWTGTEDRGERRCVVGKRKDGSEFEMELSGSKVYLNGGWLHTWFFRDITQRRNLERQLAFAQKMESVGRLAAGIAHEINTPIQYIGHNTSFLESAIRVINQILNDYEDLRCQCEQHPDLMDQARKLADQAARVQLEFLRSEIPVALEQTAEGTQRVSQIVSAMKEFSHPGTRDKTYIHLNRAIESTVTISRNEWKYVSRVELDLADDLPKLLCHPGDLNQAILNLIVNAAHAIESQHGSGNQEGLISISTRSDGECIEIRISDNGTGIPQELLSKIYDPFFTTKPQGKGTGQGLALVYTAIVERHAGTVDIETEVGRGTTFILRLPLHSDTSSMGAGRHVAACPVC